MKKILALLLVTVMAACAFASCVPTVPSTTPAGTTEQTGASGSTTASTTENPSTTTTNPSTPTTQTTATTTTQTTATTATTKLPEVPELDNASAVDSIRTGYENVNFDGHTFTFAAPINTTDGWSCYEVCGEQNSTGFVNDSIAKRNALLKQHYNANVKVVDINSAAIGDTTNAGGNNIDIVVSRYILWGKGKGNFYNLHSLGIDFNKPWWDTAFINDTTIDGKMYGVVGAFSTTSFDATQVIYFNNTVKNSIPALKNVDFYDLVTNNEWTLDTFLELVRMGRVADSYGDTIISGYVSTKPNLQNLYFGYIKKTDGKFGGTTFESAFDQNALSATDKIISLVQSDAFTLTDYTKVSKMMQENTTLFTTEVLRYAANFAGKFGYSPESIDFGILPFPKLSAAQESYSHAMDSHFIYLYIAKSATNISKIAQFLDLYAYHSYYTVYKDYIATHGEEFTGDKKATDIVDIILKSRYFDLAYEYNFDNKIRDTYVEGILNTIPSPWHDAGPNPIYTLRSRASSIISAANKYKDSIKGLEAGY